MRRFLRSLLLSLIILFLVDCEQPTDYEEVEVIEYVEVPVTEIVTEYITEVEYVEVLIVEYIETETIVGIFIVSDVVTTTAEAITEYDNYVTTSNVVYGVSDDSLMTIEKVTDLFIEDDVLYFNLYVTTTTTSTDDDGIETVTTESGYNAYSQTDSTLTLLDELPDEPDSEFVEFESGDFVIDNMYVDDDGDYVSCGDDDDPYCSYIYNGSLVSGYLQVDGACMMGDDLLFSVSTTISIRYKGVYKYEVDGSAPKRIYTSGRVW